MNLSSLSKQRNSGIEMADMDEDKLDEETAQLYSKGRIPRTLAAWSVGISLGMINTIFGPTLVPLEDLFSTDTTTLGVVMACRAGGFLIWSLLCF